MWGPAAEYLRPHRALACSRGDLLIAHPSQVSDQRNLGNLDNPVAANSLIGDATF